MRKTALACLLIFTSATVACSNDAATGRPADRNGTAAPSASQEAGAAEQQQRRTVELRQRIEQIASEAKGRVGVAAVLLETGESVSLNPREHFPMQSVYKFPIGMAALRQVDEGKLKLEQRVRVETSDFVRRGQHSPLRDANPKGAEVSVRELMRLAVAESDGTASDVLLRLVGGARAVGAYLGKLKIEEIAVINTEKEIGQDRETQYRNWATPDGAVALLRALHEGRGLSAESRALLLKFLTETETGANRLKGGLPAGTTVAHKTGTSGTEKGVAAATNDIGLLTLPDGRHVALAVFVADSTADAATREGVIAKIARAVWDEWGGGETPAR